MAKSNPRKRRWWLLPLVVVTALGVGGYILSFASAQKLEQEIARARGAGMIVTREDLEALKPQTIRDAYPVYVQAAQELEKLPKETQTILRLAWELLPPKGHLEEVTKGVLGREKLLTWEEVSTVAETADKVFDLMERANQMPDYYDPNYRTYGAADRLTSLQCACAIAAEAAAKAGDFKAAHRLLRLGRGISTRAFTFPSFLKLLQGVNLDGINETALRRIILMATNETDLDRVAELTLPGDPLPSFKIGLRSEALATISDVDTTATTTKRGFGSDLTWQDGDFWRSRSLLIGWIGNPVKGKILRLLTDGYTKLPTDPLEIRRSITVLNELSAAADHDDSYTGRRASELIFSYSSSFRTVSNGILSRLADSILVELQRHKIRKGVYPSALPEKAAATLDPMSGKPFHYRLTSAGFVLYGVGVNGKDEGGRTRPAGDDFVLRLESGSLLRS